MQQANANAVDTLGIIPKDEKDIPEM